MCFVFFFLRGQNSENRNHIISIYINHSFDMFESPSENVQMAGDAECVCSCVMALHTLPVLFTFVVAVLLVETDY